MMTSVSFASLSRSLCSNRFIAFSHQHNPPPPPHGYENHKWVNTPESFVYTYRQRHHFVSGTFDLLDVMCKQHHRTTLNPFLNDTKTVTLAVGVNKA